MSGAIRLTAHRWLGITRLVPMYYCTSSKVSRSARCQRAAHTCAAAAVRSNAVSELRRVTDPSQYADENFMWEQLTQRSLVTKAILL